MQKKKTKSQTRPPLDREAIRVLAIELGAREAARRTGVNENTILSWSRRHKWHLPKRTGGPKAIELQSKPGDVLIASHKELEGATKTGLMITAAKAATKVAQNPPLEVSSTSQLRDLAQSAARIFGWEGSNNGRPGDTYNNLVVTTEQFQLMREFCETPEEKEYNRKMGNQRPPAPPVPIGYEVKVTP